MKIFAPVSPSREPAIYTGSKLPPGAKVMESRACMRCDAPDRELCAMRIWHSGIPGFENVASSYQACAECLADFVASDMCVVDVQDARGKWRRVGKQL